LTLIEQWLTQECRRGGEEAEEEEEGRDEDCYGEYCDDTTASIHAGNAAK
jgi:hypothetical protein